MRRSKTRVSGCSECDAAADSCAYAHICRCEGASNMQYENLTVAFERQVATVTLNRPDVRNAFNEAMIAEVTAAFRELNERDDVRAVVLAANGKAFCAGADLNWWKKMAGFSDEENRAA